MPDRPYPLLSKEIQRGREALEDRVVREARFPLICLSMPLKSAPLCLNLKALTGRIRCVYHIDLPAHPLPRSSPCFLPLRRLQTADSQDLPSV
jgi:hypothetical protein